jgi:hypothetical protein
MKDRFGFIQRFFAAAGAIAVVVVVGALVTPNTAHALVAALVQITNTTNNPAMTQDVSKAASQIVSLYCRYDVTSMLPVCSVLTSEAEYVVPAGKSLVVTAVDITSTAGSQNVYLMGDNGYSLAYYGSISGQLHYTYPSGIVFAPGSSVNFGAVYPSTSLYLYGYLTSN